ncbi:hypothetical protein VTK73DRAFT_3062 [Phialemonium thermophilum]|uniref:Sterol regulatory element-binding protein cleavage-activating protein n=1 Tax=Phialemonium thermophilum TaxID=223376 RepID=A0ABR3X142_9PEZI
MIWYLLYPLRGTTEAPVLHPTHPLRSSFTRYGKYAARHVLATLLISVAMAMLLTYPCPFLYTTDFSSGASSVPHHVWTDAQPVGERTVAEPDVIMRSIWVHGSYMQALDRKILLGALELQDELLGPTKNFNPRQPKRTPLPTSLTGDLLPDDRDKFHVVNGLTNQSWFFHSPLLYWACSAESIKEDPDLVATVNAKKTQSTSANVTLRHSIVFSGKRFEDRKLIAADALVITLIHLRDSPVGKQWERNAEALVARVSDKWTVIPADGRVTSNQIYEFQFKPMTLLDRCLLTLAYLLLAAYLVSSFSKLRAVKSRLGLFVAACTQIVTSMISSLTICAIFKVDLSKMPYFAYPLVVLAISLENSIRLINATLMTPADHSISSRIGEAFGETAHVAVAGQLQNLLILWGLSRVTYPGVAAFCTFAAIASIFDFLYLSTFFLSVLSVDVRRLELSDALEKAAMTRTDVAGRSRQRRTWLDAVLQGKIGRSTRIAGSIVILGFVFIAEWHFLGDANILWMARRLFHHDPAALREPTSRLSLLVDIHQARSPTSWLRLQDHETAKEVINVVKPWAHSYTARVYDPLIFVLKGTDRMPHKRERFFLPAVYDFIHHEMPRFIVVVLVVVALVRLFLNYLLFDEIAEVKTDDDPRNDALLKISSLAGGHILDVAMLTASPNGLLVSVGLDRNIQVWDVRRGSRSRVVADLEDTAGNPFPVQAMTIDRDSTWLAFLSPTAVLLWHLLEQRWGPSMDIDTGGQRPRLFLFDFSRPVSPIPPLLVVRRDGFMLELDLSTRQSREYLVCKSPLVCAVPIEENIAPVQLMPHLSILTASRRSCIHQVTHNGHTWLSEDVKFPTREEKGVQSVLPIPSCSAYLIVRLMTVDLVDFKTGKILHTFQTESVQYGSLRLTCSRRRQSRCGSHGLSFFTLAYVSAETGDCVLQTYLPADEGDTICFCDPANPKLANCCVWGRTRAVTRRVANPGTWEALPSGSILGVRQMKNQESESQTAENPLGTGSIAAIASPVTRTLRHRRQKSEPRPSHRDTWEVWVMSQLEAEEKYEEQPLMTAGDDEDQQQTRDHLMVTAVGPMVRVGTGTVAVGMGDIVKVISVGHEHFDGPADRLTVENLMNLASRRRKALASPRMKPSVASRSRR